MYILALGLNHKTTPVEMRERLAIGHDDLAEALSLLRSYVTEGMILSTCNRTEIYGLVGHRRSGAQNIQRFLCDYYHLTLVEIEPYLYLYGQEEAIGHLFRVASGIDSMIVGEPQVLGQVRDAFEVAQAQGCVGAVLSSLFRQAISVGKRVRTETDISKNAASVSYAAVELARKIFSDLARRTVLIVGAGKMGELTAKTLIDNGVAKVIVANRTYERAVEMARRFGGSAVEFSRLPEALSAADIVLTSTGAPNYIIEPEMMHQACQARHNQPIFLIDIAVPRDVDPEVENLENVYLFNIDDLQAVCESNLREREKEIKRVEAIIEGEVAKFMAWWASLDVVPTISALRHKAENIRQMELTKALGKLSNLSDREREIVNALTVGIINKLLHHPIVSLKDASNGRNYVRAVQHLFRLDEER
ncbi:MAG: glutamyl-tRNA reductase [Chloroflexi bacterium]|nr:glutamyl-tRNA reductase [Chloroflexota bacterium]MCL5075369.1 glutamyl-tRNA reductase [Chloroflexota bacterium]